MLRKRVITVLTFNDGVLFRTKLFTPDYRYTLNFVDSWSVDEIVVLDVTRPGHGSRTNFENVISRFARTCFVPLAAGGGIRTLDDVARTLDLGADKIVVNTAALARPGFITDIAERYGRQCAIIAMDARLTDDSYEVMSTFGTKPTGRTPVDWAREAEAAGAGELLVTAIERDGALQGYDLELCRGVADAVSIPVLIAGGAGNWKHFADGFDKGHASAVCTSNIYHFTEASIRSAKAYLQKAGVDVRAG